MQYLKTHGRGGGGVGLTSSPGPLRGGKLGDEARVGLAIKYTEDKNNRVISSESIKDFILQHSYSFNIGVVGMVSATPSEVGGYTTRPVLLKVKEALHIQTTSANNGLNKDWGYELPGCWIVTMKKLGGGVNSNCASAIRVCASTSAPDPDHMRAQAQELRL